MAVKRAAHGGLRAASLTTDRLRPPAPGVTFLIYHRVGGESGTSVDLPVEQFRDQVAWLAEAFDVVSIDQAASLLRSGASKPSVVLTFDDGTADWTIAMEVLAEANLPATFYVATRFVDKSVHFPHQGTPISWSGLADMVATGLATVGSHTHTHRLLHRTDAAETAQELDGSVALIEDNLGVPCRHFAYPKAMPPGRSAAAEVARRFETATLAGGGPNRYGHADLLRLRRTPIQTSDDQATFGAKARGGLRVEGLVRDLATRVRFRSAEN
jgi:peptidoglycan/xylan/chitin deacetylase (PgdA/CDA1 family)